MCIHNCISERVDNVPEFQGSPPNLELS